jgi:TetR/AcrR family transcriptional regulator, transcriptional repressor for nem operon
MPERRRSIPSRRQRRPAAGPRATAAGREALLRAGWAIARRAGLRGLTVRAVARAAKANLGTFVYHFGSREAFVTELVERWYEPLLARLQLAVEAQGSPLVRLRHAVLGLTDFALQSGSFVGHLLMDAAGGEPAARAFLGSLARRHPVLLMRLIREAQARGEVVAGDPMHMMMFMMSSLGLPVLLVRGWSGRRYVDNELMTAMTRYATERASIEQRLEWILKGLRPEVQ